MIIPGLSLFALLKGVQSVVVKDLQVRYVKGFPDALFIAVSSSFLQAVLLFLLPPYAGFSFQPGILWNPLLFSAASISSFLLLLVSLGRGPNSLTYIIVGFSGLVPILAGLVIWKETVTPFQLAGLAVFLLIVFLFNGSTYRDGNRERRITPAWVFSAVGTAVCTGIAVIFTKRHMLAAGGLIREYLLLINLFQVLIGLPILVFFTAFGRYRPRPDRRFLAASSVAALLQDLSNIIYMNFITSVGSASFFPLVGILNSIAVVLMSRVFLKEKISAPAYAGIGLSFLGIWFLGK